MSGQRYGTVHAKFWMSARAKGWNAVECQMALYLLTSSHSTIAGACYLPLAYIAEDLGYPIDTVSNTLSKLSADEFCTVCERSKWIVVNNRLAYDSPKGPKQAAGILNIVKDMPEDHPGWPHILKHLQPLIERYKKELSKFRDLVDRVSKPYAKPYAASDPATDPDHIEEPPYAPLGGQSDVDPSSDPKPRATRSRKPKAETPEFAAFWAAYPRKVSKPAALKAWAKITAPPSDIMQGLAPWVVYWRLRNEPEYIPHPSTWLNDQRWNDRPPTTNGHHPPALADQPDRRGKAEMLVMQTLSRRGIDKTHPDFERLVADGIAARLHGTHHA